MIPQGWDWVIIALVFLLLFGAKKLPEMARSIGQSARVFKSEMKGMKSDDEARAKPAEEQPPALPATSPTPPETMRYIASPAPMPAQQSVPRTRVGETPGSPDTPR